MQVTDPSLAFTEDLLFPWRVRKKERYAFDQSPHNKNRQDKNSGVERVEIILTVDEKSYVIGGTNWTGALLGHRP